MSSTWVSTASSDWNTAANWGPTGVPQNSTDTAIFANKSLVTNVTLSSNAEPGGVIFQASAWSYTITSSNLPAGLAFAGSGVVNNSANLQTFSANGGIIQFAGAASAGGNVLLTASNRGLVQFGGNSDAAGAQMQLSSGGELAVQTAGNLNLGALSGTAGVVGFLGSDGPRPSLTVGALNTNTTYAGTIIEDQLLGRVTGSLVKTGTGTLTLTGANTYTGGTTVTAGTLVANVNATQSALSTGAASVASGAFLTLNNTQTPGAGYVIHNTFTGAGQINLNFNNTGASDTVLSGIGSFTGTINLTTSVATGDKLSGLSGTLNAALAIQSGTSLYAIGSATLLKGVSVSGAGNNEGFGAIRLDGGAALGGNISLLGNATLASHGGGGVISGAVSSGVAGPVTLTLGTANAAAPLTLSGVVSNGAGTVGLSTNANVTLSSANSFSGGATLNGGALSLAVAGAAGTGAITFAGASTLETKVTATLSNAITVNDGVSATFEAVAGATLTTTGAFAVGATTPGALHFGSTVDAGTVNFAAASNPTPSNYSIFVDDGTLKLGSAVGTTALFVHSATTTIASGAMLDFNGFLGLSGVGNLSGAGVLTSSAGTGSLESDQFTNSQFDGIISGGTANAHVSFVVTGGAGTALTLTGANTYNGGTFIDTFATLQLGAGGATGSVLGNVSDNGTLAFDRTGSQTFAGIISGIGAVKQKLGRLVLTGANTYSGGTTLAGGTLSLGAAGAAGTGTITFAGGAFDATITATLGNALVINAGASATLGAAAATTLTLTGAFSDNAGASATLHIGSATDTGTVVLRKNGGAGFAAGEKVVINGGALSVNSDLSLSGVAVSFTGTSGKLVLNGTASAVNVSTASGAAGAVDLNAAQVNCSGGGETVRFASGAGDVANLSNTAGVWDTVSSLNGATGAVNLTSALAQVYGGGQTLRFAAGSGDAADLINTGGVQDIVSAAGATTGIVYLDSAQAQVTGGGENITFFGGAGNVANLVNTNGVWDVTGNANGAVGTVNLNSALSQVWGGNETVHYHSGAVNGVNLVNTGGVWDNVFGDNGVVGTTYFTSANAQVWGGGENLVFWSGTGDAAHLLNTNGAWDVVTSGNGTTGTLYLTNALVQVWGGGETLYFNGGAGNAVHLLNTGATADTVADLNGANGTVYLTNASASISGGGETVAIWGGTGNIATLSGANYGLLFNLAAFGQDTINGFAASDTLTFNLANQGHLAVSQSGADTLITLDANDVVTLKNYLGAVTLNYHA